MDAAVLAASALYFGFPKKVRSPACAVCSEAMPRTVSVVVPRHEEAWIISMISAGERENSMICSVHGYAILAMVHRAEDKKTPLRGAGFGKVRLKREAYFLAPGKVTVGAALSVAGLAAGAGAGATEEVVELAGLFLFTSASTSSLMS